MLSVSMSLARTDPKTVPITVALPSTIFTFNDRETLIQIIENGIVIVHVRDNHDDINCAEIIRIDY